MSASPARSRLRGIAALVASWTVSACGARNGFAIPDEVEHPDASVRQSTGGRDGAGGRASTGRSSGGTPAERPPPDASVDAAPPGKPDARVAATPEAGSNDASPIHDASQPPHDAVGDVETDAPTLPDCSCPADSFSIDANVDGELLHLTEPLRLFLYCEESAPQIANPPCGSLYTLSACAKPNSGPPCLYLAVDFVRGPVIGHYADATGQTWFMQSASLSLDETTGRTSVGSFAASFERPGDAGILSAYGTFRVCTTRMPACSR